MTFRESDGRIVPLTGRSFRLKNGGRSNDDQKKNKKKPEISESNPSEEEKS